MTKIEEPPPSPRRSDRLLIATLRAAWESISTPLMLVDQDTRVLIANPAAQPGLDLVGLTVGDRLCSPRLLLLHSDGQTPVARPAQPLARAFTGSVVEEEYVLRVEGDSGLHRYRISAYPLTGSSGYPLVLLALRDVTAGGESGTGWREAIERLSWLVESSAEYAVFMLDAAGLVTTWSTSAEQLLGCAEPQALGHPFERFFAPVDRAAGVPAQLLELARRSGRAELEGQRLSADGREFWSRGVITAIHGEVGELLGFVCVTHDITVERTSQEEVIALNQKLRELNEELERRIRERTEELQWKADELAVANRELEAFSYTVSHDLRAPLRAMSGFARILEEEHREELDAEGLHYLERIEASARQMGQLIDGLLAFSRLLRQQLAHEPLDMNEMVTDTWRLVRPPSGEVRLEAEDLPSARGDRQLVLQVWQNLLENAVKFARGRPDPVVRVFATTVDDVVRYCVQDNGVGFDMRFAGRLFRPFQRLHGMDEFPGNGIGLALVDRIVKRHGGSIEVSAVEHQGATFCFSLGGGPAGGARELTR